MALSGECVFQSLSKVQLLCSSRQSTAVKATWMWGICLGMSVISQDLTVSAAIHRSWRPSDLIGDDDARIAQKRASVTWVHDTTSCCLCPALLWRKGQPAEFLASIGPLFGQSRAILGSQLWTKERRMVRSPVPHSPFDRTGDYDGGFPATARAIEAEVLEYNPTEFSGRR